MTTFFYSAGILSIIPIIGAIAGFFFTPMVEGHQAEYTTWLMQASLVTLAAALGMLMTIAVVGAYARSSRSILLSAFSIGIWLVKLVTIGLVLANATILILTIAFAELIYLERLYAKVIFGIAMVALYCCYGIIVAAFKKIDGAFAIEGQAIERSEGSEIWAIIDDLAQKVGTAAPDNLVVGLEPNFFVTEQPALTFGKELSGRTLYLSLAATEILSKDELKAIIGHELAHFSGEDLTYAKAFYPIYRRTQESIDSIKESESVTVLPIIAILQFFLDSFAVAESELSRERELVADAIGAQFSHAEAIATGLVKLHAACGSWASAQNDAIDLICEDKPQPVSYIKSYREKVSVELTPESIAESGDSATAHPFDSHPPLAERLTSLGLSLDDVSAKALKLPEASERAITLFAGSEELDTTLSQKQNEFLVARIRAYQQAQMEEDEEDDAA